MTAAQAQAQAQRDKDASKLYPELKANYEKLTSQFVSQENLDKLGSLITEYGKNVGGGDKTGFLALYRTYEPVHNITRSFRNEAKYTTDKTFKTFVDALIKVSNVAWLLQLVSPAESDQILQKIWLLCGEIANEVKL